MYPVARWNTTAVSPPTKPPRPTTEATAWRGYMSLTVVNRLADHHCCAAAAMLTKRTAIHMLPAFGANIVGAAISAAMSIATLRDLFSDQPRFRKKPEI